MTTEGLYQIFKSHPSIETDSRHISPGCIFFALKGERFNGNLFAGQALQSGAAYCVVDEDTGITDERIIRVGNCLEALQELARHHRQQFDIPFIGITGSNGKTTTKELIHAVLSSSFRTYTTVGNLNNHIGIPLTLLRVKPDAEMAIVEMGANHQKEIEGYCLYAMPTHGLITNCGKAHLEGFGGVEGVKKGKGELYDYLGKNNGKVFLFSDYDYLQDMSKGIGDIITYGTKDGDITGTSSLDEGFLTVHITRGLKEMATIRTKLVGEYNLPNVLAAVCIGRHFGVEEGKIIAAIENYEPTNSRSQMVKRGSNEIILDAYNANPSSMRAAIENFVKMDGRDKVVMLGGMMELGEESMEEHRKLVDLLRQHSWKRVVLVGKDFRDLPEDYLLFDDSEQAGQWFREQRFENCMILVKGSRSMRMERVLE